MNIHEKIAAARQKKKMSMAALAKAISDEEQLEKPLAWQAVQQWENGKTAPDRKRLNVVAKLLDTTVDNLLDDSVDGLEEVRSNVEDAGKLVPPRGIPVIGYVKGGDNGFFDEFQYPVGTGDGYVQYWTRDPNAYALRVKGQSMAPRYREGEYVVVTPNIEAILGQDVIVRMKNGKKLLKQLGWTHGEDVQLVSINNGVPPMIVKTSEIESIHRVGGGVPHDAFMPW